MSAISIVVVIVVLGVTVCAIILAVKWVKRKKAAHSGKGADLPTLEVLADTIID